jgi:hypothetical protein
MNFTSSSIPIDALLPHYGIGQNNSILLIFALLLLMIVALVISVFSGKNRAISFNFSPIFWLVEILSLIGIMYFGTHLRFLAGNGWTLNEVGAFFASTIPKVCPPLFLVLFIWAAIDICIWYSQRDVKKPKRKR